MIKIGLAVVLIAIIVLLSRMGWERMQAPELTVAFNHPPPGTVGGRYVYIVGFTLGSGSPFTALSVTHVDIGNHANANVSSPMCSEKSWAVGVSVPSYGRTVWAEGPPAPGLALRFDSSTPDVSYTVREMNIEMQFDYKGWFTWKANKARVTVKVPVPYAPGSLEPQVMDDANYDSLQQDIEAGIPHWYGHEH